MRFDESPQSDATAQEVAEFARELGLVVGVVEMEGRDGEVWVVAHRDDIESLLLVQDWILARSAADFAPWYEFEPSFGQWPKEHEPEMMGPRWILPSGMVNPGKLKMKLLR